MKKLGLLLSLLLPTAASAQSWGPIQAWWQRLDGGAALPGSVSSVGLACVAEMNCSGTPVTSSGTITQGWVPQSAGLIFAAPPGGSGAPTFQAMDYRHILSSWVSGRCLSMTSGVLGSTVCGGGGGSVATDAIWVAAGDLAVGTGSSTAVRLALGGANTFLHSNGSAAAWAAIAAADISNNLITDAMLRQSAALSLIGRSANSTGNVADISATAASGAVLRESGSTIGFGTLASGAFANNTVAPARLAFAATQRIGCRTTAGAGAGEECTMSNSLDWIGSTRGSFLQRAASSSWSAITPHATAGMPIVSNGTGADIGYGTALASAAFGDNTIAPARLAVSATDRLVGRDTTGAGAGEELTVGGGIEFTGSGGIQTSAFTGGTTKSAGSTSLVTKYRATATIENPGAAEDKWVMLNTTAAATITQVCGVLPGGSSTPSVTFATQYGTDVSAAGTAVTTSPTATTSTTTCATQTLNSTAIPSNGFLWFKTTAQSGTVPKLTIVVEYTVP